MLTRRQTAKHGTKEPSGSDEMNSEHRGNEEAVVIGGKEHFDGDKAGRENQKEDEESRLRANSSNYANEADARIKFQLVEAKQNNAKQSVD